MTKSPEFDLSVGEQFQGGTVVALHAQEGDIAPGVVLTHRDYQVWTIFRIARTGDVIHSSKYVGDMDGALLVYSTAVTATLHALFNRKAPGVTFLVPNLDGRE